MSKARLAANALKSQRAENCEIKAIPELHKFPKPDPDPSTAPRIEETKPPDPPYMSKRWITDRFADYVFQNQPEQRTLHYDNAPPDPAPNELDEAA